MSEKLARIFKKRNIVSAMKPNVTLKNLLVHPKDKSEPKEGVYTINCTGCDKKYIGETKRKLHVRDKEHRNGTENPGMYGNILACTETDAMYLIRRVGPGHCGSRL